MKGVGMATASSASIAPEAPTDGVTGDAGRPADPHSIAPGDRVRWNDYVGRVETVNGETAVVVESNNRAFGRTIRWRIRLDALVRC